MNEQLYSEKINYHENMISIYKLMIDRLGEEDRERKTQMSEKILKIKKSNDIIAKKIKRLKR